MSVREEKGVKWKAICSALADVATMANAIGALAERIHSLVSWLH